MPAPWPALPDKPVFSADPLNLFVVVESGDHHVTILDGDRFEPIHRFPSRYALHGGPKFSADGRYVFFGSRDGWITKYDLYNLTTVAEVRAGINLRNIALSSDGRYVAAANYLPHSLVILDAADLKPLKVIPTTDRAGKATSRVSAVYDARPRGSFIVALKDIPELWEVAYRDDAKPIYRGFVHSYEAGMVEGVAEPGKFGARRIALDQPLDDFFFDPDYRHLLGSGRDAGKAVVVNLDVGRPIATIDIPGLPHLGSGITWTWQGRTVMATPNLKEGCSQHHRHAGLERHQADRNRGPGLLPAQPREHALCLGRRVLRSEQGCHACHRQEHAGGSGDAEAGAGTNVRPCRIHPRRPLRPGQPVGEGRRRDRLRRRDVQGGQAPAHGQAFRKIQRLQQDQLCRMEPVTEAGRMRAAPLQSISRQPTV